MNVWILKQSRWISVHGSLMRRLRVLANLHIFLTILQLAAILPQLLLVPAPSLLPRPLKPHLVYNRPTKVPIVPDIPAGLALLLARSALLEQPMLLSHGHHFPVAVSSKLAHLRLLIGEELLAGGGGLGHWEGRGCYLLLHRLGWALGLWHRLVTIGSDAWEGPAFVFSCLLHLLDDGGRLEVAAACQGFTELTADVAVAESLVTLGFSQIGCGLWLLLAKASPRNWLLLGKFKTILENGWWLILIFIIAHPMLD